MVRIDHNRYIKAIVVFIFPVCPEPAPAPAIFQARCPEIGATARTTSPTWITQLAQFYRRWIAGFSTLASPLTELT